MDQQDIPLAKIFARPVSCNDPVCLTLLVDASEVKGGPRERHGIAGFRLRGFRRASVGWKPVHFHLKARASAIKKVGYSRCKIASW